METEEYSLCEHVINMVSIVDIREKWLRSRREPDRAQREIVETRPELRNGDTLYYHSKGNRDHCTLLNSADESLITDKDWRVTCTTETSTSSQVLMYFWITMSCTHTICG